MNIYQIFVPELATYVKYKVLDPDEAKTLLTEIDTKPPKEYRRAILESVIFNIKTDVSESLRKMSRTSAEKCLEALYTRMHYAKPRSRHRLLDRYCLH